MFLVRTVKELISAFTRRVMGRRHRSRFTMCHYRIQSVSGVKALGVVLIIVFCMFMYGPTMIRRSTSPFAAQGFGDLTVKLEIVSNPAVMNLNDCPSYGVITCSLLKLHLVFRGNRPWHTRNWKLYFPMVRRIVGTLSKQFKWTHINGDLNSLEPTSNFEGFTPDTPIVVPIIIEMYLLSYSDVMSHYYIVEDTGNIILIENTKHYSSFAFGLEGENLKKTKDESTVFITPEVRYDKNVKNALPMLDHENMEAHALPTPKRTKNLKGRAELSGGVVLKGDGLQSFPTSRRAAIIFRFESLGIKVIDSPAKENRGKQSPHIINIKKPIMGWKFDDIDPYQLRIEPTETTITGSETGLFYGLQTFLSLISLDMTSIPAVDISDSARFNHRGFMLDVARNFKSKSTIYRVLDQMSAYKLNVFHFHLSDDEGWRLEIPGLDELIKYGSKRCHDTSQCLIPQLGSGPFADNSGNGYYTIDDYKDIIKYADALAIKVIPEFDMPGHARAAVMAMEHRYQDFQFTDAKKAEEFRLLDPEDTTVVLSIQFYDRTTAMNPCLDSTYQFIRKIVSEVKKMHKDAGQELNEFNIGGDESKSVLDNHLPWEKSPACMQKGISPSNLNLHFLQNIGRILSDLGLTRVYAWSDLVGKNSPEKSKLSGISLYLNLWDVLEWNAVGRFQRLANTGFTLINTIPDFLYFDMPQEASPYEKGYYWATRYLDLKKVFSFNPVCIGQNSEYAVNNIGNSMKDQYLDLWPMVGNKKFSWEGMQANLWSETVRNEEDLFFMIFPRLIAAAERAWHKGSWELDSTQCAGKTFGVGLGTGPSTNFKVLRKEYELFSNIVFQREYPKFDAVGINYRVPPPGYRVRKGMLDANVEFPGFLIQVSTDGGKNWFFYDENDKPTIQKIDQLKVRTVTHSGKQFSRDSNENLKATKDM